MEVTHGSFNIAEKYRIWWLGQLTGRTHRSVTFDIVSDVGQFEFSIEVIPNDSDPPGGVDGAIQIAVKSLAAFGKGVAEAAENYQPPAIYSPKSQ